ncbi:MAG TPA: hypothetical protein IAA43_01050 [Candidatus Olsenella avicola]|nr:hypothetical protein [Candidatus Olsenella avicola]
MSWAEHVSSPEGFRQTGKEGKTREKTGKLAKQVKDTENWRTRMNRLFKSLEKYDIGLLITIDEIRVTLDEMIAFASTYQLFVREGKRVGLLMAGLLQQVSALLRDESVSFLRRCVQHHLSRALRTGCSVS